MKLEGSRFVDGVLRRFFPFNILLIFSMYSSSNITPSSLQSFNNDLVKALETLRHKREGIGTRTRLTRLVKDIEQGQLMQAGLMNQIKELSNQLEIVNENVSKDMTKKLEYDRLIGETEAAYIKVIHSRLYIFLDCRIIRDTLACASKREPDIGNVITEMSICDSRVLSRLT